MQTFQYHNLKGIYFKTGIIPTINTKIEVDNAGFNSNWVDHYDSTWGAVNPTIIGSNNSDWDNTAFVIRGSNPLTSCDARVGNRDKRSNTLTIGNRYNFALDKTNLTIDDTNYSIGATSFSTSSCDLWLGVCNMNGSQFRNGDIYAGNVRIYQDGVLVLEWIPTVHNGEYTYFDTVSNTYATQYGDGTITPGPANHTFNCDTDSLTFPASGGSLTFDVEAETTWTASTPTFVSLSPSTGASGTTTVTVTCPSWTGETRREEIITFTDADDWTFDVKMRQRANTQVFSNIYLGDNQVLTMYIGDNNVSTIYLGDNDVFSS